MVIKQTITMLSTVPALFPELQDPRLPGGAILHISHSRIPIAELQDKLFLGFGPQEAGKSDLERITPAKRAEKCAGELKNTPPLAAGIKTH